MGRAVINTTRAMAHAGVQTTISHEGTQESFDLFCQRQTARVRERGYAHLRRYHRRVQELAAAIEPTWELTARGIAQGHGAGSFYRRVHRDGGQE